MSLPDKGRATIARPAAKRAPAAAALINGAMVRARLFPSPPTTSAKAAAAETGAPPAPNAEQNLKEYDVLYFQDCFFFSNQRNSFSPSHHKRPISRHERSNHTKYNIDTQTRHEGTFSTHPIS